MMKLNPQATAEQDSLAVIDDTTRVAAILSPIRRRILNHLHEAPDSATGLARKLALPRQKINYHLRKLERAKFLELAEERQRRGCVERTLRPMARAYLIDPALLGDLAADPEKIRDRFSSTYLIAVAGRLLRDVTTLRSGADLAGKRLPTMSLQTDICFRNQEDRAAFAEELAATVARLTEKYHDASPGSRTYRFVIAGHPAVVRKRQAVMESKGTAEGNKKKKGTRGGA